MTLRDQLVELGIELAARLSNQERAVANARAATTELSRARVERDSVELFLHRLHEPSDVDDDTGSGEEIPAQRREHRASGS